MARLIDADALLEKIQFRRPIIDAETKIVNDCVMIARKAIVDAPTVDAKPVMHGRWIIGVDEADYDYGICSVCGFAEREHIPCLYIPNYCPNCGAKMDGDGNGT